MGIDAARSLNASAGLTGDKPVSIMDSRFFPLLSGIFVYLKNDASSLWCSPLDLVLFPK